MNLPKRPNIRPPLNQDTMNQDITPTEPARNPASSEDGAAYLLALALGDSMTATGALEAQRQRVAALRDPTSPQALEELSRQLPVLEAVWHRLAAEALRSKYPGAKAQLLKAALQAQQAHARTFALLRGLALQDKGMATVTVESQ